MTIIEFQTIGDALRYDILRMTEPVKSGHPTTSFSAVDLLTVLFFKYFRYDLTKPDHPGNDRLIFSKGHASALFYALYHVAGAISEKELLTYRHLGSPLEGHPVKQFPFTEAATGSLGQGLAIGAGMAWALRKKFMVHGSSPFAKASGDKSFIDKTIKQRENGNIESQFDASAPAPFLVPRVFVVVGDGELSEGSNWEAIAWSAQSRLSNLIAVVDVNGLGQSGSTALGRDMEKYRNRFESFGWGAIVIDGHDYSEIDAAFEKAIVYKGGPVAILARTRKGKGVSEWEDKDGWHNKMLPEAVFRESLAKFDKTRVRESVTVAKPDEELMETAVTTAVGEAFPKTGYGQEPVATKEAFGNALVRLGGENESLIVLDGDVANSLHTDKFRAVFPERFLEMSIAEQLMVGVATGLSRMKLLPVVATFAAFLTRAHDQFRMAPLSGATIIVDGSYGGVSVGRDGPSQFGMEDLAMFRAIPGSVVLYPSDPFQTEKLLDLAVREKGIVYVRTTRESTPVIYRPEDEFTLGGSRVFPGKGKKDKAAFVAAGITLHEALKAQKQLEQKGISVRVIDLYSVKPIDKKSLTAAAKETGHIVVVEDHYPEGGIGEAVLSALGGPGKHKFTHLSVRELSHSGTPAELLALAKIDMPAMIEAVKNN